MWSRSADVDDMLDRLEDALDSPEEPLNKMSGGPEIYSIPAEGPEMDSAPFHIQNHAVDSSII